MSDQDGQKAKTEAEKRIQLEKQGKMKPSPKTYVIMFPFLVAIIYYLLERSFVDSITSAVVIVIFWLVVDELVYRYRMRKEK